MPLMFRGVGKAKREKVAAQMLRQVGLEKRMHHRPNQMSGGQQQRVGIARAFVSNPKIVFADEPTGNLDTKTTIEVMAMMVRMCRQNNQTLILVTHDSYLAQYADRIVTLIDGKIVSDVENKSIVDRMSNEEIVEYFLSENANLAETTVLESDGEIEAIRQELQEGRQAEEQPMTETADDPAEPAELQEQTCTAHTAEENLGGNERMKKKTYVRVITLLLAVLMILGVMAPAFTSYAASQLSLINNSKDVVEVGHGTPDENELPTGTHYFKVGSDLKLYVSSSSSSEGKNAQVDCKDNNEVTYGGLTFTKKDKGNWKANDSFNISVMSTTTDGDAQIIASNISRDSRITKGRSISLNLTILDTSLRFGNQQEASDAIASSAYVSFKQGDFKRGKASGDTLTNITVGAGKNLQYDISMTDLVYTGSGDTVEFVVGYTYNGKDYKYNMSMKIPGCIPFVDKDDPDEDEEDVDLDPLTPHIIVSEYSYGATQVSGRSGHRSEPRL